MMPDFASPHRQAAFMKKRHLQDTLRRLAGHLVVETDEQRRNVDLLYKALGEADLPDDERRAIQSDFSIGKADFFFDDTIPKQRLEELDALAAQDRDTRGRTTIAGLRSRNPDPALFAARLGAELGGRRPGQPIDRPLYQQGWPPLLVRFLSCGEADRSVRAGNRRAGVALSGSSASSQSRRPIYAREGGARVQPSAREVLDQCPLPGSRRTRRLLCWSDY